MPELSINARTGELVLGPHRLTPGLAEPELLKSAVEPRPERIPRRSSNGFYQLKLPINAEHEAIAVLEFLSGGLLQGIRLKLLKPQMRMPVWSKQVEQEIKRSHDLWLKEQLGNPSYVHLSGPFYQFSWGRIASLIELPHNYSATINIDYTRGGGWRALLMGLARMAQTMRLSGLSRWLFRAALRS